MSVIKDENTLLNTIKRIDQKIDKLNDQKIIDFFDTFIRNIYFWLSAARLAPKVLKNVKYNLQKPSKSYHHISITRVCRRHILVL